MGIYLEAYMPGIGAKIVGEYASALGPKAFNSLVSTTAPMARNALSSGIEHTQIMGHKALQMGSMVIENGTKLLATAQETVKVGADMIKLGTNLSLKNVAVTRQNLATQLGNKREQLIALQSEVTQQFNHLNQVLKQEFEQGDLVQTVQRQGMSVAPEVAKFIYETGVNTAINMVDTDTKAGDVATFRDITQGNYRAGASGIIATLIANELQRTGFKKLDAKMNHSIAHTFKNFCRRTSQFALPAKLDYNAVAAAALLAASTSVLNQKTGNKPQNEHLHKKQSVPITVSFENKKQTKKSFNASDNVPQVSEPQQRPKI